MKGASIIRRGSLLLRSAKAERSLKILYLGIEDIFGHRSARAERKRKKAYRNGKASGNRYLTYVTNDEKHPHRHPGGHAGPPLQRHHRIVSHNV